MQPHWFIVSVENFGSPKLSNKKFTLIVSAIIIVNNDKFYFQIPHIFENQIEKSFSRTFQTDFKDAWNWGVN